MLVLTRKDDEQILIGDEIRITLIEGRPGKARIGISAPNHVKIVRSEIVDREPELAGETSGIYEL